MIAPIATQAATLAATQVATQATPLAADPLTASLLAGGFVAALLHAALPTHWLPFVLVGRAQGWGAGASLGIAALAAVAHIASTALVGGLIAWAGTALGEGVEAALPYVGAAILGVLGLAYLARAVRAPQVVAAGLGAMEPPAPPQRHAVAALGLIGLMVASPGEALLPLYLGAAPQGAWVLAALSLALLAGTLIGMVGLVALARAGVALFRLERLARYEGAILGLALIALAIAVGLHH